MHPNRTYPRNMNHRAGFGPFRVENNWNRFLKHLWKSLYPSLSILSPLAVNMFDTFSTHRWKTSTSCKRLPDKRRWGSTAPGRQPNRHTNLWVDGCYLRGIKQAETHLSICIFHPSSGWKIENSIHQLDIIHIVLLSVSYEQWWTDPKRWLMLVPNHELVTHWGYTYACMMTRYFNKHKYNYCSCDDIILHGSLRAAKKIPNEDILCAWQRHSAFSIWHCFICFFLVPKLIPEAFEISKLILHLRFEL